MTPRNAAAVAASLGEDTANETAEAIDSAALQAVYNDAVDAGIASGALACPYPHEAARAIVTMGTMVATWYHAGGGMTPQAVADIYVDMAMDMVRADSAVRLAVRRVDD